MAKTPSKRPGGLHYRPTVFWISLISLPLILLILLEAVCLGVLYVRNSIKEVDNSKFVREHFLTSIFASTPTPPVQGKHFLGDLRLDRPVGWSQFLVADGLLGWRLASAVSAIYPYPSDAKLSYLYITDDNGFIADVDEPPVSLQKSVGVYRVIVLGGSTVMGEGSPRPSQNIVGMLRKGVQERGLQGPNGKRVELINAGVDGYNSAQAYLYLVSDLLRFKPDLVVVYDGWNDNTYDFNKNLSPFRTAAHSDITRRIARSYSTAGSARLLADNLGHLLAEGNFQFGTVELFKRALRKLSPKADAVPSPSVPLDLRNVELYRQTRGAFSALADDQLSIAIFLQPLVGTDNRTLSAQERSSWWYLKLSDLMGNRIPFYDHARHILSDLKAANRGTGIHCIADLSHSLSGVSEAVYVDSGHLLPSGNEIVAGRILDQLVSCGLLGEFRSK